MIASAISCNSEPPEVARIDRRTPSCVGIALNRHSKVAGARSRLHNLFELRRHFRLFVRPVSFLVVDQRADKLQQRLVFGTVRTVPQKSTDRRVGFLSTRTGVRLMFD